MYYTGFIAISNNYVIILESQWEEWLINVEGSFKKTTNQPRFTSMGMI